LEAVVEDEGVGAKFGDGEFPAVDAVFVDDDGDAGEVFGEHEGLVAGVFGGEEDAFSVADDFGK